MTQHQTSRLRPGALLTLTALLWLSVACSDAPAPSDAGSDVTIDSTAQAEGPDITYEQAVASITAKGATAAEAAWAKGKPTLLLFSEST